MPYTAHYTDASLSRADVDALPGDLLIEFGVDDCPHCRRVQPLIETAMQSQPALRHIKVEDGAGRRLGRTFRVKLWPTLILMRDGQELGRVVRPTSEEAVADLFAG